MTKNKLENKLENKLLDLLEKNKLFPQRFLVITKDNRVIHSYANKSMEKYGYGIIFHNVFNSTGSFHDRGKILDDVLKLEFLISQIIFVKLSNKEIDFFDYEDVRKWNKFLDSITFNKKIEFLFNFNLVNKEERKKIDKIRNLRNQAAHSLNGKYLEYDNEVKDKKEQFDNFRKDIENTWDVLVDVYHEMWSADEIFEHAINLIEKKYDKK